MTPAPPIITVITAIEEYHLAQLVDDFIDLIDTSRSDEDPAIERLTPTPYPQDVASAVEFAESTRDDLLDRRLADARRMRSGLGSFDAEFSPANEAEALISRELAVPAEDIDSWLRTLTAIRLVVATRLGITTEDDSPPNARHEVYDWLGYRLELLIEAADDAGAGLGD